MIEKGQKKVTPASGIEPGPPAWQSSAGPEL